MAETIKERLKNAWDVFNDPDKFNKPPPSYPVGWFMGGSSIRQDKTKLRTTTERSIVISVLNRIAVDVSEIAMQHVKIDENGQFEESIPSGLNYCLTTEANMDQTSKAFIQDVVLSMFDEGYVAIVPTETTSNPNEDEEFDILSMRTGKILEWYPEHVKVSVYNQETGQREDLMLHKKTVAIIENPLYPIMNEPNSTLKRLVRKLSLLDIADESSSGKLDLIVQLPFVVKGETRQKQAEDRVKSIEMQLTGTKYGVGYVDAAEKITQLNRPLENNLLSQIQYLTTTLYNQLGFTEDVFNGTASEAVMLNYNNRTITPIISALVDEPKRKFLSRRAREEGETILPFRDPFKLVPVGSLADIADKFTRNAILSSNEIRGIIGFKPSTDPTADELRNKNLNPPSSDENDNKNQNETDPL